MPLVDLSNSINTTDRPNNKNNRINSQTNLANMDNKDIKAIGAALKKFQTMPANFHPESLVSKTLLFSIVTQNKVRLLLTRKGS